MGVTMTPRLTCLLLALWSLTLGAHCSEFVRIPKPPDDFASRLCGSVDTESTIELSCPHNTCFHVTTKAASENNVSNCSGRDYPSGSIALSSSSASPPLAPECRGQQSSDNTTQLCNETIQVDRSLNKTNLQFVEVAYECINNDVMYNLCDDVSEYVTAGDVYLASPSLFSLHTPVPSNTTCTCTLTSTADDFRAQALYLSQAEGWNVTCQSCDFSFQKQTEIYPAVNKPLFWTSEKNHAHIFRIDFQPSSQNSSNDTELWMNFKGNGREHLQCNGGVNTPASTSTTQSIGAVSTPDTSAHDTTLTSSTGTATTSLSPSSTSRGTDPMSDNLIYIIAGVVVGVIIIVIIVIVIIDVIRQRRHKETNAATSPGADSPKDTGVFPSRLSLNDYYNTDLTGKSNTRTNPFLTEDHSQTNGGVPVSTAEQSLIPSTGTNQMAGQNVYFILEPQPDNKKERGDLFLTDTHGNDLLQDGHGHDNTRDDGVKPTKDTDTPKKPMNRSISPPPDTRDTDDSARNSNHYYSEVKELESLSAGKNEHLGHKQKHGPVSYREYEDGVVQSDNYVSLKSTSRSNLSRHPPDGRPHQMRLSSPSSNQTPTGEGADNDEHQSATSGSNGSRNTADDQNFMIVNELYESSSGLVCGDKRNNDQ